MTVPELLRKIADANKACDLIDEILKLENIPVPLEDLYGLKNEIERIKVDYANKVDKL